MGSFRMFRGRVSLLAIVGALAVAAPAAAAPGECPEIMPTSSLTAGMVGEGWTVSQGTTPELFDVEVLGVLPDAIGPGRDMIIVDTSSPAIDAVGGIWFGMSGSPVYVGGKLIGAVAFGLSFGPSPIAGLTPASELLTVHGYPTPALRSAPATVRVPRALARRIAHRTGRSTAAASTLARLKMPLSVSGVDDRGFKRVNALAKRRGTGIVAYRGASAQAVAPADPSEIVPGGNFAAALSYGDVTVAGIGTTSYVCDARAVAFGHRFFHFGATSMAASVANALTIVGDSIGGPFKLATVGGTVGILDQDRTGGIRALLGTTPNSIPIESSLTSRDTLRSRHGQTDAVLEEVLPDLGFLHVLSNIDSVQDAIGPGSARLGWTISGTDEAGEPWMMQRRDVFASDFDLAFESAVEVADDLAAIGAFRNDGVNVEHVLLGGSVEQTVRKLSLVRVLVRRNGRYVRAGSEITASPRQLVRLRVVLKPSTGGPNRLVHLRARMPERMRFGAIIEIVGGPVDEFCEDEDCQGAEGSFPQLLDRLESRRRHDVLAARVLGGGRLVQKSIDTRRLDQFVDAFKEIFVSPRGGGGAGRSD